MAGAAQSRLAVDHDLKALDAAPKPAITLALLWPEPDWAQCIARGVSPNTAAFLAMVYQGFATAPLRDGALGLPGEVHVQLYQSCVASMQKLFEQATKEDLETLARQFHGLTGVPRDSNGVPMEVMLRYYALGRAGGRSIRSPFALSHRALNLARALPDLGWPRDTRALKTGICHWHMRTGAYGVAKFTKTGIQQLIQPRLTREVAAREALRLIGEELDRHQRERRSIPKRLQAGVLQRSSADDVRASFTAQRLQTTSRYAWVDRPWLCNQDGSHHVAAAKYIAKRLDLRVPLMGTLITHSISEPAVKGLREDFDVFAMPQSVAFGEFYKLMEGLGATWAWTDLPRPFEQATGVFLPKSEVRSCYVASQLHRVGVPDLGAHLDSLVQLQKGITKRTGSAPQQIISHALGPTIARGKAMVPREEEVYKKPAVQKPHEQSVVPLTSSTPSFASTDSLALQALRKHKTKTCEMAAIAAEFERDAERAEAAIAAQARSSQ